MSVFDDSGEVTGGAGRSRRGDTFAGKLRASERVACELGEGKTLVHIFLRGKKR